MRIAIVSLLLTGLLFAQEKQDKKEVHNAAAAQKKKYAALLEGARRVPGLWTLYRKRGKVYLELGKQDYGRSFLLFSSVARGVGRGWTLGGMTIGTRIVRFRHVSDEQVHLVEENPRFLAKPKSPLARAVASSYGPSVLAALRIAAHDPDRDTDLVDLGGLFLTDLPNIAQGLHQGLGAPYRFDSSRSSWHEAKAFPKNVELEVNLSFASQDYTDLETVPDSRFVEVVVHYSVRRLPHDGFRPRRADDRVGYFLTAVRDFSQPGLTSWVRYINHWRIERAQPDAALSAPKEPLVFWIGNSVPYPYRHAVREGILEWNKAFNKIGIQGAIEARQMPEDADWDPEDARYNTFCWITSQRPSFGAIGPSRVDPRTGEILDADILYEEENLRGLRWGFLYRDESRKKSQEGSLFGEAPKRAAEGACELSLLQAPENTLAQTYFRVLPGALKPATLDGYIQQSIKDTVMHEVGHTLGLRHNFKASTMLPLKDLQDDAIVAKEGLTASVMEYSPVNLSLDPKKQGYFYTPTIGPYDYWAIRYGYQPIPPGKTAATLNAIASECDQPGHQYATDEDTYGPTNIDPTASIFDLSSDPLGWCKQRMDLVQQIWKGDWAKLQVKGFGYLLYRAAMSATLYEYRRALDIATRWVGGIYMNRRHPGDKGLPFHNVPLPRQKEALSIVVQQGFAPGLFQFSPDLVDHLAIHRWSHWGMEAPKSFEFPLEQTLRSMRREILDHFFSPAVLTHIEQAELGALKGEPPLTLPDLYQTVFDAVWSDVKAGQEVSRLRRDLQRDHTEALVRLVLDSSGAPEDARDLARLYLQKIRSRCDAARKGGVPTLTEAHLAAISARIQKVLDLSLTRSVR